MKIEIRISSLASKVLANEASVEEIAELNNLLCKNPGAKETLINIFDTWDMIKFDHGLDEKQIEDNITLVLGRINEHINLCGINPEFTPNDPIKPLPGE